MKPRRILAADETHEIFDGAARENALAVVSVQHPDGWKTFKARFLERDSNRRFFVLDHQGQHGTQPPQLEVGQYVGVSFRSRSRKVMFATVVEARGRYLVGQGESLPAVRYRWPDCMTELQRRAYFRTPVPAGLCVLVNAWPGGVGNRANCQSTALGLVSGDAVDLSCGGTLMRTTALTPPPWTDDQTIGVEIHLPDGRPPVMVNAHYRGERHEADGGMSLALQFVGLELSTESRSILTRLARCVQRFHRQMISSGARTAYGEH